MGYNGTASESRREQETSRLVMGQTRQDLGRGAELGAGEDDHEWEGED